MMRLAVMILALLAGAKIWTQDQIFRSAAEDALIGAYKAKAIESCRGAELPAAIATQSEEARRKLADAFATPAATRLEIGNRDIDVRIWEVDHVAWAMRYKYPYIVLDAAAAGPSVSCSYDIKLGRAVVKLM